MEIEIHKAELSDIDLLIEWRIQVLHEVFSIKKDQSMSDLEHANREY